MGNELVNQPTMLAVDETIQIGKILAESGFFSDTQSAAQAVAKILAGQELGFGPLASMTGIHIVRGKVVVGANLLAAAIKRSGKYDYVVRRLDDEACIIGFMQRNGDAWIEIGESAFTMQDATSAGLSSDNWKKYRRNMLFARAISNGERWFTPDVLGGPVYTPDEMGLPTNSEGDVVQGALVESHRPAASTARTTRPEPQPQSNGGNGHKWPARPWEAETLRAYMQQRAGEDTGEPDDEAFRRMHAAMHTLTLGDEDKRKRVQEYLFDVQSSTELTAGQVQALYRWVGTTKDEESGEWLPSAHAVSELAAVVRAHQIENGQEDLFEDLFGEQQGPAQEPEPA